MLTRENPRKKNACSNRCGNYWELFTPKISKFFKTAVLTLGMFILTMTSCLSISTPLHPTMDSLSSPSTVWPDACRQLGDLWRLPNVGNCRSFLGWPLHIAVESCTMPDAPYLCKALPVYLPVWHSLLIIFYISNKWENWKIFQRNMKIFQRNICLLYTSDAADE